MKPNQIRLCKTEVSVSKKLSKSEVQQFELTCIYHCVFLLLAIIRPKKYASIAFVYTGRGVRVTYLGWHLYARDDGELINGCGCPCDRMSGESVVIRRDCSEQARDSSYTTAGFGLRSETASRHSWRVNDSLRFEVDVTSLE